MNFGPLEFGAYLRRQESYDRDSAESRHAGARADSAWRGSTACTAAEVPPGLASVYEAIIERAPGLGEPVRVRVQPAWRPLVLVLSSHQGVHWQIEAAPGVDLRAVLLAGSGESTVSGITSIPVSSIGGFYAFKPGSHEFRYLEGEVARCTGCTIEHFHRTYVDGHFDVGLE